MASSIQNSPRIEVQQEGEPSPRSPRAQPEVERVARRVQNFVEITDHLLSIQGIRYVQRGHETYERNYGAHVMSHTSSQMNVVYLDGKVKKLVYTYTFPDIQKPPVNAPYSSINRLCSKSR